MNIYDRTYLKTQLPQEFLAYFFCDIWGSHTPSGGMSNNEVFWASVHCRSYRPAFTPACLAERAKGPKHRFGFVIEVFASTENGNFATGALDIGPDMLRRVSSTGDCNNPGREVPPGFFVSGVLVGAYVAIGGSIPFITPLLCVTAL